MTWITQRVFEIQLRKIQATKRRDPASAQAKISNLKYDCDPAWVSKQLQRGIVHDQDFALFGRLNDGSALVLDVGANWGYSVCSMRSSGCRNPILSLEVLPALMPCLEVLKAIAPNSNDCINVGVGSVQGELNFYSPVLGNTVVTALTTAKFMQMTDSELSLLARNLVEHLQRHLGLFHSWHLSIVENTVKTDKLDNVLEGYDGPLPTSSIGAIKIDVEGFEHEVLRGASNTIARDLPILMIEGGNRNPDVKSFLDQHGYKEFVLQSGTIVPHSGLSEGLNGLFFHPDGQRLQL
ncbi:MAG: FkbM family methyltransferase [Alphaproteobacteria bacterium]|nr:FkbM family methyltransferase [Alphaproteobacteria bacterium]